MVRSRFMVRFRFIVGVRFMVGVRQARIQELFQGRERTVPKQTCDAEIRAPALLPLPQEMLNNISVLCWHLSVFLHIINIIILNYK